MKDKYESETLALRQYCLNKNVTCLLGKKTPDDYEFLLFTRF